MKHGSIMDSERPPLPEGRVPMPREARAKQFSPFDSLRGFSEELRTEREERKLEERRNLSEEEAASLDEALSSLCKGARVSIIHFVEKAGGNGVYEETEGIFSDIAHESSMIRINAGHSTLCIPLSDIYSIRTL